jgi:indole-3-pyruvate monooxygenase
MKNTKTLIIGASVSGLASAASLHRRGIEYSIIEKGTAVAAPWRSHYQRLHLHTNKSMSHLPFKKFDRSLPRYPSRRQLISYLEDYQRSFHILPDFNTEAFQIKKEGDAWITETNTGLYRSRYIIMSTGAYERPNTIQIRGMETFPGKILHSANYQTGEDFKGQHVLVIGFGNSACEIAIDLYEQGAFPAMSVRSPVNIVPRDIAGIPIVWLSLLMSIFPPRFADRLNHPLIRWVVGDIRHLGLKPADYGPLEQFQKDGRPPVLDIGTVRHIREGHIKIFEGIDHIEKESVCFENGQKARFDSIVAATGFHRNYDKILDVDHSRFDDLNRRIGQQKYFGKDGLYFCGFWISPTGQFREIGMDAKKIARDISLKERSHSH